MFTVTVVPLSTPDTLSAAAWARVQSAGRLFLQTEKHPSARPVLDAGLSYVSMDDLYAGAADFDALNAAVGARLAEAGDCVYAATGCITATQLPAIRAAAEARGGRLCVLPGVTLAEAAFPELDTGLCVSAAALPEAWNPDTPITVMEIDSAIAAGEVKLALSEYVPDETEILLACMDASGRWTRETLPLFELDRRSAYDATTTARVPGVPFSKRTRFGYADVLAVMRRLRAPDGCPWDREQTHKSLKVPLMEECYELLDAIDEGDDAHLTEELGDVLMQVVFHAEIAAEQGRFTERDVSTGLVEKLVYRHPHVFGAVQVANSDEVLRNWDKLKKVEKAQRTQTDVLKSVPRSLPALTRAKKVQKKAGDVGFDWSSAGEALPKVHEEADELLAAVAAQEGVEEEAGDLLFAAVNVVRLLKLDPELTLTAATDKFLARFEQMETLAADAGATLDSMTLAEMDTLWNRVKKCRK